MRSRDYSTILVFMKIKACRSKYKNENRINEKCLFLWGFQFKKWELLKQII